MRGTKMRIAAASMLLCAFASAGPLRAQDDVVMKAMRDEMDLLHAEAAPGESG